MKKQIADGINIHHPSMMPWKKLDSVVHEKNKKACTLTAVRPIARFGELKITGNTVNSFNEKPQLKQGWIKQ